MTTSFSPLQSLSLDPTYEWPFKFGAFVTLTTYVLSEITSNVSQVDRLWSFLPTIYAGYFALVPLWRPKDADQSVAGDFSPRALMMFGLTLIWTTRLSYNTYRKGLFSWNDEDYRWQVLRDRLPKWQFHVVNLTFIAITQNILLLLLAVPVHAAIHQPHTSPATSDYILFVIAIVVHLVEFTADNQHQSFQKYKRSGRSNPNEWPGARIKWTPADAKRGFCTDGMWGWSRHPNFLCEQLCWIIINLFPLCAPESSHFASQSPFSLTAFWAIVPALSHCALFFSSTLFTESITSSKYPGYAAYQQRVSMFVPFLTPIWGFLLMLRGKKQEVDAIVYGKGVKEVKSE